MVGLPGGAVPKRRASTTVGRALVRAPTPTERVTWAQVHRFRLGRHALALRSGPGTAEEVLRRVGGVQAQVLSAAELSLWCRVAGWRRGDLSRAIDRDRKFVRTWCMRRTLFVVPARDLSLFARGTQRRADKEIAWARRHGISARELERLLDAVGEGLEQPSTRRELSERVAARLGRRLGERQGYGWGSSRSVPAVKVGRWNIPAQYMLHLYGARMPVCYGPANGTDATYVRGDRWVTDFHDREVPAAEEDLLRLYLSAYGPAGPSDFARWTGIGVTTARQVWQRIGAELVTVDVEGWRADLLARDVDALLQETDGTASVRLLPYFDTYLLGHESRRHLVEAMHHRRVYRNQGWIAPTVLVDGRVAATWSSEIDGRRLLLRAEALERWGRPTGERIRTEATGLAQFLGCERAVVRVVRGLPAGRR